MKALIGQEVILVAEADDSRSREFPGRSSAWSAGFRSGVSPGPHSSVAQSALLCTESFVDGSDQCGCRKQPEVIAKDGGSSVWLRKNKFCCNYLSDTLCISSSW